MVVVRHLGFVVSVLDHSMTSLLTGCIFPASSRIILSDVNRILPFYDLADLARKCPFVLPLGSFWGTIGKWLTVMNSFHRPLKIKTDGSILVFLL